MLKKLFIFPLSFTIMTILVGCDDNDFAPYTNYEKNLNETISSQPSSIFDIADEVTNIAQEYKDRAELRR